MTRRIILKLPKNLVAMSFVEIWCLETECVQMGSRRASLPGGLTARRGQLN